VGVSGGALNGALAVAAHLEARRFVRFAAGRRAVRLGDEIGVAASTTAMRGRVRRHMGMGFGERGGTRTHDPLIKSHLPGVNHYRPLCAISTDK